MRSKMGGERKKGGAPDLTWHYEMKNVLNTCFAHPQSCCAVCSVWLSAVGSVIMITESLTDEYWSCMFVVRLRCDLRGFREFSWLSFLMKGLKKQAPLCGMHNACLRALTDFIERVPSLSEAEPSAWQCLQKKKFLKNLLGWPWHQGHHFGRKAPPSSV